MGPACRARRRSNFVSIVVVILSNTCRIASAYSFGSSRVTISSTPTGVQRTQRSAMSSTVVSMSAEQEVSPASTRTIPAPSKIKGVLLDMDGTLTDSDTLHYDAYRETLLKVTPQFNGGGPITREYYDKWMSGNSNTAIVNKLFPGMPDSDQIALWRSKEDLYRKISTKMTPLPGLLKFLERCETAGLEMIVVTNAPRLDAIHTLKVLDLYDRFGETMVIGYECSRPKPHADPYLEGLRRLGLSAESCVAFEDSINGVSSAISAGIYTIGMGQGSHERLPIAGAGLCVANYLDGRLPAVIGLDPIKN